MTILLPSLLDGRPARARRDEPYSGYAQWVELPVDGKFYIEVSWIKALIRSLRGQYYSIVIESTAVVVTWRHGRGKMKICGMAATRLMVRDPKRQRGSITLDKLKRGRRLVEGYVWPEDSDAKN